MKEKFSWKKRGKSFVYAARGIKSFITQEHNAWIHAAITVMAVAAGFALRITRVEWTAIILCIGIVFAAEAFNTAIERLVDIVSPGHDKRAGNVKDIAAGAVLICAIMAATVGMLIFIPRLLALIP